MTDRDLQTAAARYVLGVLPSEELPRIADAAHVLPNILGRSIVYTTLLGSHALLAITALGFLGLGIQPPAPEWGNMLANARTYLGSAPWLTVFPAIAIVLFILGLNLLGEALRDLLDPKLLWRP
jgi:ABC-type dipeptide/oligopeptide/nickel transport system permease subunit